MVNTIEDFYGSILTLKADYTGSSNFNFLKISDVDNDIFTIDGLGNVVMNYGGLDIKGNGGSGGMSIHSGGLSITGGLSIISGGFYITGGLSVLSQGLSVQSDGFATTGGITINNDGLVIHSVRKCIFQKFL